MCKNSILVIFLRNLLQIFENSRVPTMQTPKVSPHPNRNPGGAADVFNRSKFSIMRKIPSFSLEIDYFPSVWVDLVIESYHDSRLCM